MNLRVFIVTVAIGCGGGGGDKLDAGAVNDTPTGCVPGSQAIATVYLNFTGATYSPAAGGMDDATINIANPIDMTRTLAPWPYSNTAEIKACVEEALKPFRIMVTDVDPGAAPHHEIVMTTESWENAATRRSVSSPNCGAIRNSVSFVFGTPVGNDTEINCDDVLLQFAVASAGLDHVMDCHDYLAGVGAVPACGPKTWLTTPVQCGDGTTPHNCTCGGQFQISKKKMTDKFGASCAP
jgi:hypothetical protein